MLQIYEYFGLEFWIYPDDHYPIHIHVKNVNNETAFQSFKDDYLTQ